MHLVELGLPVEQAADEDACQSPGAGVAAADVNMICWLPTNASVVPGSIVSTATPLVPATFA